MDEKELIERIKNQVIEELKKEYFLIKKTGEVDIEIHNSANIAKNKTLVNKVSEIASEIFNTKIEILYSDTRKRPYTDIRYMIFLCCRECFKYPIPFSVIASPFKKNHSTVVHGYSKALDYYKFNKEFAYDLNKLKEAVKLKVADKIIQVKTED